MRFKLDSLPDDVDAALDERLVTEGHVRAEDSTDALVVGLLAPSEPTEMLDVSVESWAGAIAAVRRTFMAVRDFAAELTGRGAAGRVVVVVDPHALRVAGGTLTTAVPGAFLLTAARVAALELADRQIAVNVLVAGWVDPALSSVLARGTPLGRLARASELADACAFLISDEASFVTGSTLVVDGGYALAKTAGGNVLMMADSNPE